MNSLLLALKMEKTTWLGAKSGPCLIANKTRDYCNMGKRDRNRDLGSVESIMVKWRFIAKEQSGGQWLENY